MNFNYISAKDIRRSLAMICLAGAIAIMALAPGALRAANFYDGKTITILVGSRAGSGLDFHARSLAPFMKKHIPGNPTVIVKFMPGAGGQKAQNFLYEKARPDGQTIFFGGFAPLGQITDRPGFRSKYEDFNFVGGLGGIWLLMARKDAVANFKSSADFINAKNFRFGGSSPARPPSMLGRLGLDVLGVNYTYISGYRGSRAVNLAMRRGEVSAQATTIAAFKGAYEQTTDLSKVVLAFHYPTVKSDGTFVPHPEINAGPYFLDLYKQTHNGKMPSGLTWEALKWVLSVQMPMSIAIMTSPKAPEAGVKDLQAAFKKSTVDPDYLAVYTKRGSPPFIPTVAEDAIKRIALMKKTSPQLVAFFKEYLKAKGSKKVSKPKGKGKKK